MSGESGNLFSLMSSSNALNVTDSLSKSSWRSSGCAFRTTKEALGVVRRDGMCLGMRLDNTPGHTDGGYFGLSFPRVVHIWIYQRLFWFRWRVTLFSIFQVLPGPSRKDILLFSRAASSQFFCRNSWICSPECSISLALLLPPVEVKLKKFFLSVSAFNWRISCN